MYKNILVPLDGSTFGEHALTVACGIARRSGARIQLIYVHAPLEPAYTEFQLFDTDWESRVREQELGYLDEVAQRVREACPSVDVHTVHKAGYVANTIRDHATLSGADLVVLTTHARGAMGRFWLGSVTDELVRNPPAPQSASNSKSDELSSVPLLLVHPAEGQVNLNKDLAFRKIVIPLDGSELAEQMLPPAAELARLCDAQLHMVRVVKPIMSTVVPTGFGTVTEVAAHLAQDMEKTQQKIREEASAYLKKMAARLQKVTATAAVLEDVQPGVGILSAAKDSKADLIALATHGRRGLSRLFLGSVADKVVRGATIPILVHRPLGK